MNHKYCLPPSNPGSEGRKTGGREEQRERWISTRRRMWRRRRIEKGNMRSVSEKGGKKGGEVEKGEKMRNR